MHNKSAEGNDPEPGQGIGGRGVSLRPTGLTCGGRGEWLSAMAQATSGPLVAADEDNSL
jgi:hypothetical protein